MLSLTSMREGGVYLLPDGEEVIARADRRGGYFLYRPKVWVRFQGWGPAEYDVEPEGRIVSCDRERALPWCIQDLVDTGETKSARPLDLRHARDEFFY